MYKRNLLKSNWVMVSEEEVRVIDSNKLAFEKIEKADRDKVSQEAKIYHPVSFDEGQAGGEASVDLLFAQTGEEGEVVTEPEIPMELAEDMSNILEEAKQQAQIILDEATMQAEQMKEQAQILSDRQAQEAYEKAKAQGMQDGYQQGLEKAKQEEMEACEKYHQLMCELNREYEQKMEEMEPHLIQKLTDVYEHVFQVELAQYRNVLQHLISKALRTIEINDHYLLHVSEQDYSYFSMQKAQIIEEGCIKNASLEIVEDRTLSKNECLIETPDGIFDCSLSVQLSELKRKLQLLSYSGNKE